MIGIQYFHALLVPRLQKQLQRAKPLSCKNGMSYQYAVFGLLLQITCGFVPAGSRHQEHK